jgi:hypothetical protein
VKAEFLGKKLSLAILIIILLLAGFIRFWQLDTIPPGLWMDEAKNGNDAICALDSGDYKIFYPDPEPAGREGLYINLIAIVFNFFGIGIWQMRAISALFGTLTVLGVYLLTREISRLIKPVTYELINYLPLATSFLFAVSFWHIHFSRFALRAIMVPFLLAFSMYFLLRAIRKNTTFDFLWSSIFFGLGFYTYIPFRIAPLIIGTVLLVKIIEYWKTHKWQGLKRKGVLGIYIGDDWWKWNFYILMIIIIALPIGLYFFAHPNDFFSRMNDIYSTTGKLTINKFLVGTVKTLAMFNFKGDERWQLNFAGDPQLPFALGVFFVIGFFLLLKDLIIAIIYNRNNYWQTILAVSLILSWFVVMLLPTIMSGEGLPHPLHSIGVLPIVYIITAIGLWRAFEFIKKQAVYLFKLHINPTAYKHTCIHIVLYLILTSFIVWMGFIGVNKYFYKWARNKHVDSVFSQYFVRMGEHLNSLPGDVDKYVIDNIDFVYKVNGLSLQVQTIIFIEHIKFGIQGSKTHYLAQSDLQNLKINLGDKNVLIPLLCNKEVINSLMNQFLIKNIYKIHGDLGGDFTVFKLYGSK